MIEHERNKRHQQGDHYLVGYPEHNVTRAFGSQFRPPLPAQGAPTGGIQGRPATGGRSSTDCAPTCPTAPQRLASTGRPPVRRPRTGVSGPVLEDDPHVAGRLADDPCRQSDTSHTVCTQGPGPAPRVFVAWQIPRVKGAVARANCRLPTYLVDSPRVPRRTTWAWHPILEASESANVASRGRTPGRHPRGGLVRPGRRTATGPAGPGAGRNRHERPRRVQAHPGGDVRRHARRCPLAGRVGAYRRGCGVEGNDLLVGGGPANDVRAHFVGVCSRGQRREDLNGSQRSCPPICSLR